MPAVLATVIVCIVEEGGRMGSKAPLAPGGVAEELQWSKCEHHSLFALLPNSIYYLLSIVLAGVRNLRNGLDFQHYTFLFVLVLILFWTLLFLFWKRKLYRMIVISSDAGRQKTVFFTLTLLTLQAWNCRDAVLIGKLSKCDTGVRTENSI